MNIRNVFIVTLISLFSLQSYGMEQQNKPSNPLPPLLNSSFNNNNPLKRTSDTDIFSPSPDKKPRTISPQRSESLLFFPKGTKQGDPLATSKDKPIMQIDPQPSPLFLNIKQSLYNIDPIALNNLLISDEMKQLSKKEKEDLYKSAREKKHLFKSINEFAQQTDNQEIKTKFSCDDEYKNIQKITSNLYALKTLSTLTFPQAFFTNAQRYRMSSQNQTPDQALLALIKNEQEKISICCYNFDLENIAKKLIHKKKKGITVEVLTTQDQKNLNTLTLLLSNGISILAPQNDKWEMNHHKFTLFKRNLFGKKLLCHGSFNYTNSAIERNWEDMTISDDSYIITQFEQQFDDVHKASTPLLIKK